MHTTQLKGFFMGVGATALVAFGLMGLSGFQATSMKVGVVDITKVFNESPLVKTQEDSLRRANDSRQSVLEFIRTYPTITRPQATTLRTLSVKKELTDAERTGLDKVKEDAKAEEKKARDLQTKANPSQDDLKAIEGYRTRTQASRELLQAWSQEFGGEMAELQNQARQELMTKVRGVIAEVGKKEGYTVIYDIQTAPYAANDVTRLAIDAGAKIK